MVGTWDVIIWTMIWLRCLKQIQVGRWTGKRLMPNLEDWVWWPGPWWGQRKWRYVTRFGTDCTGWAKWCYWLQGVKGGVALRMTSGIKDDLAWAPGQREVHWLKWGRLVELDFEGSSEGLLWGCECGVTSWVKLTHTSPASDQYSSHCLAHAIYLSYTIPCPPSMHSQRGWPNVLEGDSVVWNPPPRSHESNKSPGLSEPQFPQP